MSPARTVMVQLAAAGLAVAPMPAPAGPISAEEMMPAYERCLWEGREDCAGLLAAFCLDTSDSLARLTACRAEQAALLEARADALIAEIGRRGPEARRMAIEAARESERAIGLTCEGYAARVPQADTVHHRVRCALMAAHAAVARLTRLQAGQETGI